MLIENHAAKGQVLSMSVSRPLRISGNIAAATDSRFSITPPIALLMVALLCGGCRRDRGGEGSSVVKTPDLHKSGEAKIPRTPEVFGTGANRYE